MKLIAEDYGFRCGNCGAECEPVEAKNPEGPWGCSNCGATETEDPYADGTEDHPW